ncbi:MAG TPA: hypothetical protein VNR00_09565 [Opitutus sp.]|nr:hypothetical protein [Opitutus sp.]
MSLINEALKKAQRLHHAQEAAAATDADGVVPAARARQARDRRSQLFILLAAGGTALVVLSVVITVALVNREPPKPVATTIVRPAPAPVSSSTSSEPSPVIVAPVVAAPIQAGEATKAPAPSSPGEGAANASANGDRTSASNATPAPDASAANDAAPAAAPLPLPQIAPPPDPAIQTFVDSIRVTGIRSSGSDSKVLMNDRVYRVNDIVDRTHGLKLIKVAPDALTFADANGLTYTKSF